MGNIYLDLTFPGSIHRFSKAKYNISIYLYIYMLSRSLSIFNNSIYSVYCYVLIHVPTPSM